MSAAQHLPAFGVGIGHPAGTARTKVIREGTSGILPIPLLTDFGGTGGEADRRDSTHNPEQWRFETSKVLPKSEEFRKERAWKLFETRVGRSQRRNESYKTAVASMRSETHRVETTSATPRRARFVYTKQETRSINWGIEVELQKERNQEAIELVTSWLLADGEVEPDTWSLLKNDLKQSRLSGKGLWHSYP